MSRVQSLRAVDFFRQGDLLKIKAPGAALVFFKTDNCPACKAFSPVYYRMAAKEFENSGLLFLELNLREHSNVQRMSINSKTEIRAVPHFIMYFNGNPYARYKGNTNERDIKLFINNTLPAISQQTSPPQRSFISQQNMYGGYSNQTPVYTPDSAPPRSISNMQMSPQAMASHPSIQECDPDDEDCLLIPDCIIPYNKPWETKRL